MNNEETTPPSGNPVLDDFRNFLFICWKHLGLPDPTPVQYDLAYWLQHGPRRSITEAFRGVGKSFITSAFVCWLLLRDPEHRVMVVSASKERADAFTIFTRRLIEELPLLRHLKPDRRKGDRDSSISFDVRPAVNDHSPSVKSVGITGQLTGSRANTIIADDVETPANSMTQLQRERLATLVTEFDAVLKPNGRILYLGTPQTEMSLYNERTEHGYITRIWPALYPTEETQTGYGINPQDGSHKLASWIIDRLESGESKVGDPVDPGRFDAFDLAEREASYGRSGFALQFMLDTSLSDAHKYPLKLSDLVVMDLDADNAPSSLAWSSAPEAFLTDVPNVGLSGDRIQGPIHVSDDWLPYTGSVMAIDPSGRGRDETAYSVVKMLHGRQYLVANGGFIGGYTQETLDALGRVAKKHAVNYVICEPNFGDGMFTQIATPVILKHHKCKIEEAPRAAGQKEKRIIDTLEPVMNQHRLIVDKQLLIEDSKLEDPNYSLGHQMTRLTADKDAIAHDDRLESVSMAVAFWLEAMAADSEKMQQQAHEDAMDAELEKMMDSIFGEPQHDRDGRWSTSFLL